MFATYAYICFNSQAAKRESSGVETCCIPQCVFIIYRSTVIKSTTSFILSPYVSQWWKHIHEFLRRISGIRPTLGSVLHMFCSATCSFMFQVPTSSGGKTSAQLGTITDCWLLPLGRLATELLRLTLSWLIKQWDKQCHPNISMIPCQSAPALESLQFYHCCHWIDLNCFSVVNFTNIFHRVSRRGSASGMRFQALSSCKRRSTVQHGTAPSVRHCKLQWKPGGGVSFEAHPKQIQTASTVFLTVQRYLQQHFLPASYQSQKIHYFK